MRKGIQIRIYPNDEQIQYISRLLGCSRKVWNLCLDYKSTSYKLYKKNITWTGMGKYLTEQKKVLPYLYDVHSKVLQQSIVDLNTAFTNFFEGRKKGIYIGYPQFKSKGSNEDSCRFPKDAVIGICGNRISLIRQLSDIHFKCSRRDEVWLNHNQDKIKSVTLRRNKCNQYYCSVLVEYTTTHLPTTNNAVGLDLGVKDFCVTSSGQKFDLFDTKKLDKRLRRQQRHLPKTRKGSKRRVRQRLHVARISQKIANVRKYQHSILSTKLVKENSIISIEDLNTKGMLKNHKLARSIQSQGWSNFVRMLEYKSDWYGRNLVKIDRWFPSSKTCSKCGWVYTDLSLNIRSWTCPNCGSFHDRDLNAAINILNEGIRTIGLSSPEFTHVEIHPLLCEVSQGQVVSLNREKNVGHIKFL